MRWTEGGDSETAISRPSGFSRSDTTSSVEVSSTKVGALLDQASAAAVGGELQPFETALIYCQTIDACCSLGEFARAADWTDRAQRWCERNAVTGFPGICRVHRAEILRLRRALHEAEEEVRRAYEDLRGFNLRAAGPAFAELGHIRLRVGDLTGAEEAFRQAHELGAYPQSGFALLRLSQGRVEDASAAIRRSLDRTSAQLLRTSLLAAAVEIDLASGDRESAASAAAELEHIVEFYPSTAFAAAGARARGAVQLANGETAEAARSLQRSLQLWNEVDAPFEAANVRVLLAEAFAASGDVDGAHLELETALTTFRRLGAVPDAARTEGLLAAQRGRPEPTRSTFVFTDIYDSTALVEAIGDEAWSDLVSWHDRTLRALFVQHGGTEVDHAGDGFFVVFIDSASALRCAVAIQRKLAEHRREHGFAPGVRVGVHVADAARVGKSYRGKGVHEAARVGALARSGEIVATSETIASAGEHIKVENPRTVELKGIEQPARIVSVSWR